MLKIANIGKAGKTGEILTKFMNEVGGTYTKSINFIEQKSSAALKSSLSSLRGMLELFSDVKKLKAFLERVWKTISEWFLKNKQLFKPYYDQVSNLTTKELDWMASRNIGNLGGNVLKASQIRKLRGILKQKGIHLIVEGDARYITKLFKPVTFGNIRFEKADDLFYFMRNNDLVGGFNAVNKQMILPANSTEIVVFHEMAHVKHFEEVGEIVYQGYNKLEKEMYVWKQILANRGKWTKEELHSSLGYINDIRTNKKYGYNLEPIKIK